MKKRILILGAGFAGLNAAKVLGKNPELSVQLIDRRNHHLFQPLLYQVAMAGLSPADIAAPVRSLVSNYPSVDVLFGEVQKINPLSKTVEGDFGSLTYDYLLVATGAQHSYFGHDSWEEFAPGLKTIEQATEIRRRVLTAFELAEMEPDPEKQKALLTFVVVGGGPTGVELAGALGEISRYTLGKDFRHIDPRSTRVILIEAGARILAGFSQKTSQRSMRDLEKMGVSIWCSTRVTDVTKDGVAAGSEFLRAKTVIWAAGVKPSGLNAFLESPLDKAGKVFVQKDLSLEKFPEIFVAGDQVHFEQDGLPLPGLAPVAMQAGKHAARNILKLLAGEKTAPFHYIDKGQMATIGRRRAVVEIGSFRFFGFFAWITWLVIHIYYLIGFRNRLLVLLQWIWAYCTYGRGARLIVQKDWRLK